MHLYPFAGRPRNGLGALLGVLLAVLSLPAADLRQATVTQTFNDVRVIAPNVADVPASSGATIAGERGVKTGDKSRAELEFQDRTLTRLGANTIFSFEGGTRSMEMQQGTMLLQVPKNAGGARIRTAAVTAAITGTTILLEYTPDQEIIEGGVKKKKKGKIKVIVLEGTLRLSLNNGSGQTVTLNGGQMLVTDPNTISLPQPAEVDVARLTASSLLVNNAFWGQEAALAAGQSAAQAAAAAAAGAGTVQGRLNMTLIEVTIAQQQQAIASGTLVAANALLTPLGNEIVLLGTFDPLAQINLNTEAGSGSEGGPTLPPNDGPKHGALPAPSPGAYTIGTDSIVQLDPVVTGPSGRVEGRIYRGSALDGSPIAFAFGGTPTSFDTSFGAATDAFFAPITFPSPGVTFFKFESLVLAGTPLFVINGGPDALVLIGQNGISTAASGSINFSTLRDVTLITQAGGLSLGNGFQVVGGTGDRLTLGARGSGSDLANAAQVTGFASIRGGAERDILLAAAGRLAASGRIDLFAGRNLSFDGQLAAPNVTLSAQAGLLTINPAGLDTTVILDLSATAPAITLTGSLNAGSTASNLRFTAGAGGFNAGTFTLTGTARQISVAVTGGNFTAGAFTGNALTLSGGGSINVGALNVNTLSFDGPINATSINATTINATNATFAGAINAGTVNIGGTSLTLNGGGSGAFNVPAGTTLTISGPQTLNATTITGAGAVRFLGAGTSNVSGVYNIGGLTTLSGGTTNFNGTSTAGSFLLSAGTLGGTGGLTVSGSFDWTGGSMSGSGTTTIGGPLALGGSGVRTLLGTRILVANGPTTLSGGSLVIDDDAVFRNRSAFAATGQVNIETSPSFSPVRTFENAAGGSFIKSGAGTLTLVAVPFRNAGLVQINSGTLEFSGGGAGLGGLFQVGPAGSLNFSSARFDFDAGSSISGSGNVGFTDFHNILGSYNVTGQTTIGGLSIVNFSGPTTISALTVNSGVVSFANSIAPGTTAFNGGEIRVGVGRTFTIQNPLVVEHGIFGGGGTFVAAGGITINLVGLTGTTVSLTDGGTLVIPSGQIGQILGPGPFITAGFSLLGTIRNDGSFFLRADSPDLSGGGTFLNNGLFVRDQGVGDALLPAELVNTGTVRVQTGGLSPVLGIRQVSGVLSLEGGNIGPVTPHVRLEGGLLTGTGAIATNVTSAAAITPSIGVGATGLAISGSLTLLSGSTLNFTLGGLTAGSGYGTLSAGSAALGGNLVLSFANGFESSITGANTFTLLTTSTPLTGTFANIASGGRLATSDNLGTFLVTYTGNTLTLSSFVFNNVVDATYLGGTHNWSDGTGWSTDPIFPNNGNNSRNYNAIVNSGTLTQDISGGVVIERLTMTGGTLTLAQPLTLNAGLTYQNGTIQNGTLTLAAGSLSTAALPLFFNNVTFNLGGQLTVAFAGGNLFSGGGPTTFIHSGTLQLAAGAGYALNATGTSTGTFDIPAGSNLTVFSGFNFGSGATFTGAGSTTLANGNGTSFTGSIVNNGTFAVASSGAFTDLVINGSVTLSGTGRLVLSDAARVRSASGLGTLTLAGGTIAGETQNSGSLGNNDLNLVLQAGAVIDANVAGRLLLVDPAGGGVSSLGTLRASNGGILLLTGNGGGSFDSTGGGTLDAGAGSEIQLTGGAGLFGGTLNGAGFYRNISVGGLSNLTLNSTFLANNGSTTVLTGTITNNGSLNLNSTGAFTDLVINGTVTLSGSGAINLADATRIRTAGGAATLINQGNLIQGESNNSGSIGNNDVAIVNQAGGMILANVPGKVLFLDPAATGGFLNQGVLAASGGGLLVLSGNGSGIFDSTGGALDAGAGSEIQFTTNASLVGGVLGGSGVYRNLDTASFTDVTLNASFLANNGTGTFLSGTFTNNASFTLNSTGASTDLVLNGNVTLAGNGLLTLADAARVRSNGGTPTLTNQGNLIQGETSNGGSFGNNDIAIVNQAGGVVEANVTGKFLFVDPAAAGGFTNFGTLRASNGGILRLSGNGGGSFDNTGGGVLSIGTGSEIQLVSNATVLGAQIVGPGVLRILDVGTLVDVSSTAPIVANNGTVTFLGGLFTNHGGFLSNAAGTLTDLALQGDVTLAGNGQITLRAESRIRTAGGSAVLTNNSNTIAGETSNGSLGNNDIGLVNGPLGTIRANVLNKVLNVDPDSAHGLLNQGLMEADAGGRLLLNGNGGGGFNNAGGLIRANANSEVQLVNGAFVSGGTLAAAGNGLFRNLNSATLANLTLAGNFSGDNGTVTTLLGTITNSAAFTLASTGATTDLIVDGVTLDGGGSLQLQGAARIRGFNGTFTNVNNTIHGENSTGPGSFGNNDVAIVNQVGGRIEADVAGLTLRLDPNSSGGMINRGSLRAFNGGILLLDGNGGGGFDNTGGTITAENGSEVQLANGATITGGLLFKSGSGLIRNLNIASLADLTLQAQFFANNGSTTFFSGNIVNQNEFILDSAGAFTDLSISGNVVLSGGGTLSLANAARVRSAGGTPTLTNVDNIIRGETHNNGSLGNNDVVLVNQSAGTIEAFVPGLQLFIDPAAAGGMINRGVLRAINGGLLVLTGNGGGTFDNTGGLVFADASSEAQFTGGATLFGGTLQADPGGSLRVLNFATLFDFTLDGLLIVNNGASLALGGTFGGVNARLHVQAAGSFSDLVIAGNTTFTSGIIRLQDAARVRGSGATPTFTINGTIAGETSNGGSLGNNDIALVNGASGFISADQGGLQLVIDPASAGGLTNAGLMRASNGGVLVLSGNGGGGFNNTGTIESQSGGRLIVTGALTSSGLLNVADSAMDVTSGGTYTQTAGNFVIFGGTVTNSTALAFNGGLLSGFGTISGAVTNAATIRPLIGIGSTGFAIGGSLLLQSTSRLEFTLGGLTQGSGYSFIGTGGAVTLGGQIVVSFANGLQGTVNAGNTFTIMTGGSFSGAFATALPGGRIFTSDGFGSFQFTINANSIVLSNFSTSAVLAATYSGGTNNWSNAATWSTNPLVPNNGNGGNTFDVTINNGTVTQDIAAGVTIQRLTLNGGGIVLPGGNFLTVNNLLTLSTSTASVSGPGTLNLNGGANLGGGAFSDFLAGVTVNVPAGQTVIHDGSNQVRLGGGAVFNNAGTFFERTDFGLTAQAGGGSFNNSGTFTRDVSANNTQFGPGLAFNNSGTLNVNSGTLNVNGGGSSTGGIFNVATGATLNFGNSYTYDAASSFANFGTVRFAGGNHTFGGTMGGTGTLEVGGGSLILSASQSIGQLLLTGGQLAVSSGRTLNLGGSFDWSANATLNGPGVVNANGGGTFGFSAFSDLSGGVTLNLAAGQTLTHNGSNQIRLASASILNNNGTFLEQTNFAIAALPGNGTFNNNGTFIRNTATGTADLASGIVFNNNGQVFANSGILQISGGGASTNGSFSASTGAILRFNSNYTFNSSSTLDGAGAIEFSAGTQSFAGSYLGTGIVLVSGGALTLTSNQSLASLQLTGGSLTLGAGRVVTINSALSWTNSSSLTGGGTFNANGGALFGGGAFSDLLGGSILNLVVGQVATHNGTNQIRLGGGSILNNAGLFQADSDFGVAATTGGGTVNNTGTFVRANSGGAYVVAVPFSNAGTVDVNSGSLGFSAGYTQTAGSLNLNGGNVTGSTLTLNGGLLTGFGSITAALQNAAEIRPSLGGSGLLVTGNVSLLSASTLTFNIGGVTQGGQYGFLGVTGSVSLGGTLALFITNGFQGTISPANTFTLLTSSSALSGAFSNIASGARLNTNDGLGSFLVTYSGSSLVLSNFLPPGPATATYTGTSGPWSTGSNWSTGTPPNDPALNVAIDGGRTGTNVVVNLTGNFAVRDLTIDAGDSLNFSNASTLAINNVLTNNGTLTIGAGVGTALNFVSATAVTINGTGTVTLNGNGATVSSVNGLTNGAGHTIQGSGSINGPFVNQGIVRANGSNLNFNNGYSQDAASGQLILAGGTLATPGLFNLTAGSITGFGVINGGLDLAATLTPMTAALTLNGPLTLRSTAVFALVLAGSSQASQYSFIQVNNTVALGGALAATLAGGFGSSVTNTAIFTFLTSTTLPSGAFANVAFGGRINTTDGLGSFQLVRSGNSLQLTDYLANPGIVNTPNWLSATSGTWTTGSNWSGATVPNDATVNGTGYNVLINATGAAYTITLASPIVVQGITLNSANATLSLSPGANLRLVNALNLQAGTLFLNTGVLRGGTINLSGTGQIAAVASSGNVIDGTQINGDFTLATTSALIRLQNGSTINGTVTLSGNGANIGYEQTRVVSGLTVNLGTASTPAFFSIEGNNTLTLDGTVTIRGAGSVGGARVIGGTQNLVSLGLISADLAGQTLNINANGNFTNSGTARAINGATLNIGNGPSSTVTNTGVFSATGSTLTLSADFTANGVGSITLNNSTLNLTGNFRTGGLAGINRTGGSITLSGGLDNTGANFALVPAIGQIQLAGGQITGGTVDGAGDPLAFAANANNRFNGVTVINGLTLGQASSTLQLIGGSTLAGTFNLSGNGATLGVQQSGTLDGFTANLGSATTVGFFTVESTNTLTLGPGATLRGNGSIGGARLVGGTSTLINQGAITADFSGQTLTINPSIFTNQGSLNAINGATLNIGGSSANLVTNAGTIGANNSTLVFAGDFSANGLGTVNATNSTLNLTGNFRTGGLNGINRTGGQLNLSGLIDNTGATLSFLAGRGVIIFNSGRILGGTLDNSGGQTVDFVSSSLNRLDNVSVLGGLALTQTNGVAVLVNGTTIAGTVSLSGQNADLALSQSGTFTLRVDLGAGANQGFVSIEGTNTITLAAGSLLRGFGAIGAARLFGGTGTLTNLGTITADVTGGTLTLNPNVLTNNGTLTVSNGGILTVAAATTFTNNGSIVVDNGTLNLLGTLTPSGLGTISGTNSPVVNLSGILENTGLTTTLPPAAGTFTLNGGTIRGGTLFIAPNAGAAPLLLTASSQNIFDGVTVNGALTFGSGHTLRLRNGADLLGTINLTGTSSSLSYEQTGTLNGSLTVNLGSNSTTFGVGGGNTLTLGASTTVRGFGNFGAAIFNGGTNQIVNQGTISADVSGATLVINPSGSFTNASLLQLSNGGILTLNTAWNNTGTFSVAAGTTLNLNGTYSGTSFGTINNSGGTINLGGTFTNTGLTTTLPPSAGTFTLAGGSIVGGTLNVAPAGGAAALAFTGNTQNIFSGVAVNGDLTLNSGHTLRLMNGASVTGNITLASTGTTLSLEQTSTLAGPLNLVLGGTSAVVAIGGGNTVTLGAGVAVRGFGSLGATVFAGGVNHLVNQGTINANTAASTLNVGVSGTFTNAGLVQATGGGILTLTGNWINNGTYSVAAGSVFNLGGNYLGSSLGTINNTGGTVNLSGTFTNTGLTTTLPASAGTFTLLGGSIVGGTLNVAPTAGAATLALTSNTQNIFNGVAVSGDLTLNAGEILRLVNGASVTGNITLAGTGNTLSFEQTSTLAGPLTVSLGSTSSAFSLGGSNTLTLGSAVTVRGAGSLGITVFNGGTNHLVNQGTISANLSGQTLTISPSGSFTNSPGGLVQATGGGILALNAPSWNNAGIFSVATGSVFNLGGTFRGDALGTINNSGGTVNITGTLSNAGLTTTLPASAQAFTLVGGTILGGSLNVAPNGGAAPLLLSSNAQNFLDAVAVNGTIDFGSSHILRLRNGAAVTGTINLNATSTTLSLEQTGTLAGPLTVNLGAPSAIFSLGGNVTLTLGSGAVVRGMGQLGTTVFNGGTNHLVNQGAITADVAGQALSISPSGTFTNSGTLNVLNGALLTLAPGQASTSTGTINLASGTLTFNRGFNVSSLTGASGTINIPTANDLTAPNGVNFSGASGVTPVDGGTLTITSPSLTLGNAAGQLNGLFANGGDSSSGAGGNGGTVSVTASVGDLNVNADIDATTGGNTTATGGNGGTVTLNTTGAGGAVNITSRVRVSDSTAGRRSSRGGNINVNSARSGAGTAINIASTAQLHALLDAAAPGPGGTINIVATGSGSNINVAGNLRADRGTVQVRHNATGGTVSVASTAQLRGDIVKIGALGTNGVLTIAGGTFDADTTIRLYATGSNGQVLFTGNTTLQGTSVKQIAGQTVTINSGVQVNVLGPSPAQVFTNVPNYTGFGGNGSTTGTFTGQGATTAPLSGAPGF